MARARIPVDRQALAEFCQRHHIRRLALLGSVLRPDFDATTDGDVLVEFEPGHTPGFAFFAMEEELSELGVWGSLFPKWVGIQLHHAAR